MPNPPISTYWKNHIDDLRSMALAVDVSPQDSGLSSRGAARCLLGAVRMVASRFGDDAMQRACADLARHEVAWTTLLRTLPLASNGQPPEPLWLMAAMARGVIEIAGAANTRAALAFWASADPASALERIRFSPARAA